MWANTTLHTTDDTFDFVWSLNVLEHVTPMRPYLEEIHRVLKPGGLFWGKYVYGVHHVCATSRCMHSPSRTGTTHTGFLHVATTSTRTWWSSGASGF